MTVARAASAGFWSSIDIVVRQGVQFVTSVILARLLMPADFGIIALITFFSTLASVFVQGGLTTALVQRQESTLEQESAAFWFNLVASCLFGLLLIAVAPAVAAFYEQPVLRPLMMVAAAQIVLSAIGAVHSALLSKALDFGRLAKVGILSAILSGAVGIVAALWGAGVWALALQGIVATAGYSGTLWLASRWRPLFRFRLSDLRPLIGFGAWLSVSSILEVIYAHGVSLLVGKLHGVRDLGLYTRAAGTQLLPSSILSVIIGRVALPLFAPRSEDKDATRRGMRMAISVAMLLNVPIMLGLILLPDLIIIALFGEKWLPAAPILAILAISGLVYPLHAINLQVLLAQGGSRTFFQIEVLKKAVGILCVAAGSISGIQGLAWSQVVAAFIALFLNVAPTRRSLDYGVARQLWDLRGIFLCAGVMSGVTWAAARWLEASPLVELAILVPTAACIYFACGFALRLGSFVEALDILRLALAGRGAAGAGGAQR